jgi:hypothetical protein
MWQDCTMPDAFKELAGSLAARDAELGRGLDTARVAAQEMRARVAAHANAFRDEVEARGAPHLAHVEVGPVEPDEKHVDAIQVRVWRGRWEIVYVAKACGEMTLVGPYRVGKADQPPCQTLAFGDPGLQTGADDLLLQLLRSASER